MSTIVSSSSPFAPITSVSPSFPGLVRSALLKICYLRMTWVMLAICLAVTLLSLIVQPSKSLPALEHLYFTTSSPWIITRTFSGIFLMVITSYLIGIEYQRGTIRIILSRGVGRTQLLLSQLTAVLIVMLLLFLGWSIVNILSTFLIAQSVDVLKVANTEFWREMGLYLLTVLMNMFVTILMAAAMAAVGRSLTFGMTAALSWFAADNMIGFALQNVAIVTHNDFLSKLTGYLLGPILNVLPTKIGLSQIPQQGNLVDLDIGGTHALLVALVYAVIFLTVSLVVTWKKDIKE
jgi:ABC-2 type transport system permease protein